MRHFILLLAATLCVPAISSGNHTQPPIDKTDPNSFYGDPFKAWLEKLLNPHYLPDSQEQAEGLCSTDQLQNDEGQTLESEPEQEQSADSDDQDENESKEGEQGEKSEKGEKEDSDSDSGGESGDESGDETGDTSGDESGNESGNESGDESGDEAGDKPSDKPGDKPGDEAGKDPGKGQGSQPGEKPGELADGSDGSVLDYILNKLGRKAGSAKASHPKGSVKAGGKGKNTPSGTRGRHDGDEKFNTKDHDYFPREPIEVDQDNPLVEILVKQIVAQDASYTSVDAMVEFLSQPPVLQAYWILRMIHKGPVANLSDWYGRIQELSRQDLNRAFEELVMLRRYLQSLKWFWNHANLSALITNVSSIIHDIEALSLNNGDEHAAKKLFESLPPLGRSYLRRLYEFEEVDDSNGARLFASHLSAGRLQSLELVASLTDRAKYRTRIIDNAESFKATKTWIIDDARQIGRDMLPFRHAREIGRTVRGQPGKDLEDNIIEGTAHVPKTKVRSEVPSREGKRRDPLVLSVIALDISGSMHGAMGLYQGAFATAFVLNALSERGPSGKRFHQVVIFPFDDRVHEPIWITKPQEAFHLLENYGALFRNREGNTDVTKVLLEALDLIGHRARDRKVSFQKANVVLLTDGISALDTQTITAKREAIKHKIDFFVANFRQENPKLKLLATEFATYSLEEIKTSLSEIRKRKDVAFHTRAAPQQLSSETREKIESGAALVEDVIQDHQARFDECDASGFLDFVAYLEGKATKGNQEPQLARWIGQANGFMRRQHVLLQGEKNLLECYLVEVTRYLKRESQMKRLSISQTGIEALREMNRLAHALAGAPSVVRIPAAQPSTTSMEVLATQNDDFKDFAFTLFQGDYRKTCGTCEISDAGTLKCMCHKGEGWSDTSLEHAADCFTSIENSRGILGCMPGGDYLKRCSDCWFNERDAMLCRCDYQSAYLEQGRSCLYADFKNGKLVCIKRRAQH